MTEVGETRSVRARLNNYTGETKMASSSTAGLDRDGNEIDEEEVAPLTYEVESWSSYSAQYHPKHITVNRPADQASRWSSGSNNQMQYLLLKLQNLSIIHSITFGKYYKVHVCNLKEFKIFGGLTKECSIELLHSGLRNDDEQETFPLRHKKNDITFPCKYLKIVPIAAWGSNFNFSIWYVQLLGLQGTQSVPRALKTYNDFREREAIRTCLKHLRQRNYLDVFELLQQRTNIQLEDELMTSLHRSLVVNGDYEGTEKALMNARDRSMFESHVSDCMYTPLWHRFPKEDFDESPGMRGGHQMCIDSGRDGRLYLLGGWDGSKDLADMWTYDIAANKWILLFEDTAAAGGPSARSCHKLTYDSKKHVIYTLGRYVDIEYRENSALHADFYVYHISDNRWEKLSNSTDSEGGPSLIYDHQMVIDSERQQIYVFGGRVITQHTETSQHTAPGMHSGLYRYDVEQKSWTLLRSDSTPTQPALQPQLKSRIGHSMVFNSQSRELYIFAGQRNRDYLSDFYVYNIDKDIVVEMSRDSSKQGGPDAGFTQRATVDMKLNEIYVLSGLIREKNSSLETVKNSFWVYNMQRNKWTRVYQNENTEPEYWNKMGSVEPCPRFAHQLVYDHVNRAHYLFGGNPGSTGTPNERLDDFWRLTLKRPNTDAVFRRAVFLVRRQRFHEMCLRKESMEALRYLQNELAQVVDHTDPQSSAEFRALTTSIFVKQDWNEEEVFKQRTALYEDLLVFFPDHMKQPKNNLIDQF